MISSSRKGAIVRAFAALSLAVSLLPATACSKPATRSDGGQGLLPVGSTAPEIVGVDGSGKITKLSDLKGHSAVIYFYPKDGTPGCTKEACAFRDTWDRYSKAGVTIIGVSKDSAESHQKFILEHHLPFPLSSDESGAEGTAYGVGTGLFGFKRVSFLVGPDGKIAKVYPDVDPGVHATEVLAAAAPN